MERTLVLLKPDTIQRGLSGEVITRLERRGLRIVAMKLMHVSDSLAHKHYSDHTSKPFFQGLVKFITSSPIIAMVLEADDAVEITRTTMGATNPKEANPGTVRGDLAISIGPNLIHGSDSPESAAREITLFFSDAEILDYRRSIDNWIIES